eukprot:9595159-Prorocentrum_lima.AAC.1
MDEEVEQEADEKEHPEVRSLAQEAEDAEEEGKEEEEEGRKLPEEPPRVGCLGSLGEKSIVNSRPGRPEEESSEAVSYTHLTLPTICSV